MSFAAGSAAGAGATPGQQRRQGASGAHQGAGGAVGQQVTGAAEAPGHPALHAGDQGAYQQCCGSVSFDTDPDSGSKKNLFRIQNFH